MQRERREERQGESCKRGTDLTGTALTAKGPAPGIDRRDPSPRRKKDVEDASSTEPEGGDEESNESWEAICSHDAADEREEEDGRCEEEEGSSPASFIEVSEPRDEERKDGCREG